MTEHRLKTWPQFFLAVMQYRKTFEIRKNDRDFQVGDLVVLEEWRPDTEEYTGRFFICGPIIYLSNYGLSDDMVVFTWAPPAVATPAGEDVPTWPAVAGGADGSVGFEWWNGGNRLLMDIDPSGRVSLALLGSVEMEADIQLEPGHEIKAATASHHFNEMFDRLYGRSTPLPASTGYEPNASDPIPVGDDPELDATDFAHPAWWRGHEHTALVFCQKVNDILDGKDDGKGFNYEPWGALRKRLLAVGDAIREAKAKAWEECRTAVHEAVLLSYAADIDVAAIITAIKAAKNPYTDDNPITVPAK